MTEKNPPKTQVLEVPYLGQVLELLVVSWCGRYPHCGPLLLALGFSQWDNRAIQCCTVIHYKLLQLV